jgi:hypothetical protein
MAGLLSHALLAMAASAILGSAMGLPGISWGVFAAGFIAMMIELDLDDLSQNSRSPIGHSIFFTIIWILIFSTLFFGLALGGTLSMKLGKEMILAIISAFATHLTIDLFTKEGIYTFPKGYNIKRWVIRLSKGDRKCWEYWHILKYEKLKRWQRANEDPILNALVSIPSLLIIIFFVAVMPLPSL